MSGLMTPGTTAAGGLRPTLRFGYLSLLAAVLLTSLLGACGGGGGVAGGQAAAAAAGSLSAPATPPPPASPPPASPWAGHFVGTVKIADQALFGDAYVTSDGSLRLYVGGPYDNGGELQITLPAQSEQLVGSLIISEDHAHGTGVIIGQQCAAAAHSRFCGEPAAADLSMSLVPGVVAGVSVKAIKGQIQVATKSGTETWLLQLDPWSSDEPLSATKGQFRELLAEFASSNDTVIVFDDTGAMFFQSAHSGCVGNGTLISSKVTLTIANCRGAWAYLNGDYSGLAAITSSSVWDYDGLLRVWLSKPAGAMSPVALTMLAERIS